MYFSAAAVLVHYLKVFPLPQRHNPESIISRSFYPPLKCVGSNCRMKQHRRIRVQTKHQNMTVRLVKIRRFLPNGAFNTEALQPLL